jgi:hypothetical protein
MSSNLLYQFVRAPRSLDTETIDHIDSHLDGCDRCREDTRSIERLVEMGIGEYGDTKDETASPSLWRSIFRRQLVPVYSVLAVVIFVASVLIVKLEDTAPGEIARAISQADAERTGFNVLTLPNIVTTRSDLSTKSEPAKIPQSAGKSVLVSIEAVTFEDEDMVFSARIETDDGKTVWESRIVVAQLESGRLWLLIDQNALVSGFYKLSVIEREGESTATISASTFEIVR